MVFKFTEAELFLSPSPEQLLNQWTYSQLKKEFGSEDVYELFNKLWEKYGRIDLNSSIPQDENLFIDYSTSVPISLSSLERYFDSYSILALRRLKPQLEEALNRWNALYPNRNILRRIERLINKINTQQQRYLSQDYIIETIS